MQMMIVLQMGTHYMIIFPYVQFGQDVIKNIDSWNENSKGETYYFYRMRNQKSLYPWMIQSILKLLNEGKQKVSCYSVISVIVSLSKRGTCDHQILSQIRPWPIFLWFCILLVHGLKQIPNKNATIGQPSTDFYDEVWHIGKENVRRRWVEASSGLKLCRKCWTQWVVSTADSHIGQNY